MQARLGHVCVRRSTAVSAQSATARAEPCVARSFGFAAIRFITFPVAAVARSPPPAALPTGGLRRRASGAADAALAATASATQPVS